jgi:hypothetical protein
MTQTTAAPPPPPPSSHHRLPLPRPRHAERPLPHARRQRPAHAKGPHRPGQACPCGGSAHAPNTGSTPPQRARCAATRGSWPSGRWSRRCKSVRICRPRSRRGSRKDRTSSHRPRAPTRRPSRTARTTPHATSHGAPGVATQTAGSWRGANGPAGDQRRLGRGHLPRPDSRPGGAVRESQSRPHATSHGAVVQESQPRPHATSHGGAPHPANRSSP